MNFLEELNAEQLRKDATPQWLPRLLWLSVATLIFTFGFYVGGTWVLSATQIP